MADRPKNSDPLTWVHCKHGSPWHIMNSHGGVWCQAYTNDYLSTVYNRTTDCPVDVCPACLKEQGFALNPKQ